MKKRDLIAYTLSFVSFAVERIKTPIKEIILFGSVARGDFTNNSDIDLFFNINKNIEKNLETILEKFYRSKIFNLWKQKGISNKIKIKSGTLEDWEIERSIITDGIVLYGKYRSSKINQAYFLINIKPIKNITKRNKIMRTLFGRQENNYNKEGMVKDISGKRLSPATFLVPTHNSDKILKLLKKEKIDYQLFEIFSDSLF